MDRVIRGTYYVVYNVRLVLVFDYYVCKKKNKCSHIIPKTYCKASGNNGASTLQTSGHCDNVKLTLNRLADYRPPCSIHYVMKSYTIRKNGKMYKII